MATYILGISAYYHDSAAALLKDGGIIAAAQEERFTRVKQDAGFPRNAVAYCLKEAGIGINDVSFVVFYDKPWVKFERLLDTYVAFAPAGIASFLKAMPVWLKQKFFMRRTIRKELAYGGKIYFADHHESHAASAFFPSHFEKAAILTVDGVGEWATATLGAGEGGKISVHKEILFPHSLGLLYSAFTYYTGFKVNSGEYKLMGLAPYGQPKYAAKILDNLIDVKEDGSFKLDMKYFNYCTGLTMTNSRFEALFGQKPRKPEAEITQFHMDIASSIQSVTELVIGRMARHLHGITGCTNLCMAGGVALNCVANGKLLADGPFEKIWVQPSATDAGGALGAALAVWHNHLGNGRAVNNIDDSQAASLLGPSFTDDEIAAYLDAAAIPYEKFSEPALDDRVAGLLADEKVVGWFQGRMEFGPRALGSRSILGDARSEQMQSIMNLKIKFRESFRPFAPSVLKERAAEYFELKAESPYMLFVSPVAQRVRLRPAQGVEEARGFEKLKIKRSEIPAVTHVDYSARFQTVAEKENPRFYRLLKAFAQRTGCPVLINTSFNVRGEPIVCTPEDAYKCFMRTNMDYLVMGNYLLERSKQRQGEIKIGDLSEFEAD